MQSKNARDGGNCREILVTVTRHGLGLRTLGRKTLRYHSESNRAREPAACILLSAVAAALQESWVIGRVRCLSALRSRSNFMRARSVC